MILLQLLNIDKFYGVSKTMDIAKGKNKIPMTIRESYDQIKRKIKWQ
tara:strand:- start:2058 stop:2198 length:141 start_codon:yes stop_codon:yes gene_type:complete